MKGLLKNDGKKGHKIFIIRHGSTTENSEAKTRGWDNSSLTSHGRNEAHKLGETLKGKGINILISSDLPRAVETAKILSKELNIPYRGSSHQLRTWNVGELTGRGLKDTQKIQDDYAENKPDEKIKGGESFNTFKERVLKGFEKIEKNFPKEIVGVVTHSKCQRVLDAWMKNGCPKDYSINMKEYLTKSLEPGTAEERVIQSQTHNDK
jgi:broad specificity phosphatase PhoE